jgi:hypothetical protein
MKKIIEFFKSLFGSKWEYVPTEYAKPSEALVDAQIERVKKKSTKTNNMIKEYGGKEKYPTKTAMKKHEGKESMKKEKSEKMAKKTAVKTTKKKK